MDTYCKHKSGGPNKGSATQYFLGDFDASRFITDQADTKWLDYGPDEYTGITWSNNGERKIFLGWMSNWMYANEVPSVKWRSAMTIPRELKLKKVDKELFVTSEPISELSKIESKPIVMQNIKVPNNLDLSEKTGNINFPCRIDLSMEMIKNFSLELF